MWASLAAENGGDVATAAAYARRGLDEGPTMPYLEASLLSQLAQLAMWTGEHHEAARYAERAWPMLVALHAHDDARSLRLYTAMAPLLDGDDTECERILDEVDGIVLVIDAQRDRIDENVACVRELRELLADYGRTIADIPLVVQYNKRDLADPYFMDELHRRLDLGDATVFESVATEQTGVLQTLSTISKRVIRSLREAPPAEKPAPEPGEPPTEIYRVAPESTPAIDVPMTARAPMDDRTAGERMEAAILEEAERGDDGDMDALARQVASQFEPSWDQVTAEIESMRAVRIGPELSIVSVGEATRAGDRAVRVPLVLGDGGGSTSTLVLTIQLDPLIDET
jgi:hypothetical protein